MTIFAGHTVRLLKSATDSDDDYVPPGVQGMVIGYKGRDLIVSLDRPGKFQGSVTVEVKENDVVRTTVSRTGRQR